MGVDSALKGEGVGKSEGNAEGEEGVCTPMIPSSVKRSLFFCAYGEMRNVPKEFVSKCLRRQTERK